MGIEEIETALMVFADFWQADEDAQQDALDVATRCMDVVLRMMEETGNAV